MYQVAKITFKVLNQDKENISSSINDILLMLYRNGQINDGWTVETHGQSYIATVVTTDDDSLLPKYYNQSITKEIANFDIETQIICDDNTSSSSCRCQDHSYYILANDPCESSSPIVCGNCGKEIPLIWIPYLYNENDHYSILNFQQTYNAVYTLWIDSLSDRFTKRQITDHNSQLNKRGLDIRKELENKTGKPVYYLLRNPIGGWWQFERNNKKLDVCPKCGANFAQINNSYADKVCQTCKLAFITHEKQNG